MVFITVPTDTPPIAQPTNCVVPTGGLFEYATAASYFAELWTWAGFAIMSWGPNGAFIFLVSLVNLVPRAAATHAWYLEQFPDYPPERKYLVTFVW